MLTYPQLQLPETWKPLFRALAEEGWDLMGTLPEVPDWASREILIFENRLQSWIGKRYLCFVEEPIWCGNVHQPRGFSIAAICAELPDSRAAAEQAVLALMRDWEDDLPSFVQEVEALTTA